MTQSFKPEKAFILAAGKGERMQPLTAEKPKPMIDYRGRPILDHALDKLREFGVKQVVINLHYLGENIKQHLKSREDIDILFSEEEELLDTGGGIKKALGQFGSDPFFILSGDGPWEDVPGQAGALEQLAQNWDSEKMDILMLLQPVNSMTLTKGVGDYNLTENGQAIRQKDKSGDYMFTSLRIVSPKIFENTLDGAFSFLTLMDRAESQGRLCGIAHSGIWHHLSTPQDVRQVNEYYKRDGV